MVTRTIHKCEGRRHCAPAVLDEEEPVPVTPGCSRWGAAGPGQKGGLRQGTSLQAGTEGNRGRPETGHWFLMFKLLELEGEKSDESTANTRAMERGGGGDQLRQPRPPPWVRGQGAPHPRRQPLCHSSPGSAWSPSGNSEGDRGRGLLEPLDGKRARGSVAQPSPSGAGVGSHAVRGQPSSPCFQKDGPGRSMRSPVSVGGDRKRGR